MAQAKTWMPTPTAREASTGKLRSRAFTSFRVSCAQQTLPSLREMQVARGPRVDCADRVDRLAAAGESNWWFLSAEGILGSFHVSQIKIQSECAPD